jgi:hypothetical protein
MNDNKRLLWIIGLIVISPVLLILIYISLRIWPIWLLLGIIALVILFFKRSHVPTENGLPGTFRAELISFLTWLNTLINSGPFKSFTRKLLLYPLIAIVVIAAAAFTIEFVGQDYFKARSTKKEMTEVTEALNQYKSHLNKYPENLQQLIGNNPLKKEWLSDEWKNPYTYTIPADSQNFSLTSQGKDGQLKTEDDLVLDKNGMGGK